METLKLSAPLTTREPVVLLDPRLPPGRYRVELVVASATGRSEVAVLFINVKE
ncbi:hypothetical protein [Azohydromonas aeria]|uniref:hypothetical protein n=1 Tax=Azohydromonas aeria TaxID=2590212 RepID=UPI0012F88B4F|nr:hypothetical protein [Azohydromonas aeria]